MIRLIDPVFWRLLSQTGITMSVQVTDPRYSVEIQQSPNGSSWSDFTTIPAASVGLPIYYPAPVDGASRFFRARQTDGRPGGRVGPWLSCTPTSGKPVQLSTGAIPARPLTPTTPPTRLMFDGSYAAKATDVVGETLHTNVVESGGKKVNRLYAKVLAGDADSIDSVIDGSTYARILGNRLVSGAIKRAGAFDDGSYAVLASATDGLTAGSSVKESGGKAVNRLLAKALAGDADSLDGTPDGTTYKRVTGVSSGQVQTASIADAAATYDKLDETNRPRCQVTFGGSAQTLANNTTTTVNQWVSENYKVVLTHSNVTNPSRITIPTGSGGLYWIGAQLHFASNATGARQIIIVKNGVTNLADVIYGPSPNTDTVIMAGCFVALADGDYVEVQATQVSGGNLNLIASGFQQFTLVRLAK